jgi:hypothetical protein
MKIETIQADPSKLLRENGLIYGITYLPPTPEAKNPRGAVLSVRIGKKHTFLGFGTTPSDFDRNYSRAISKLLEFAEMEVDDNLRKQLEETRYLFLQHYGIKAKQVIVWDFINP